MARPESIVILCPQRVLRPLEGVGVTLCGLADYSYNHPEINDLAERGGFEPPVQVYPAQQISNPSDVQSPEAAQSPSDGLDWNADPKETV